MPLYLLRPRQLPAWLGPALAKSATPPGTKWITVHPHGEEEPGQAVLIRESTTSPGTYHVIGGAGGRLNHLKLTHVGTPQEHEARAKERRAKMKGQAAEAKARGQDTGETEGEITEASRRNQKQFVDAVARKLGWDDNWYKDTSDFGREGLTPTAAKLAANAHLRNWVSKASEAHRDVQDRLRRDHEARVSAGLGNLSLDTDPYRATEAELDPAALDERAQAHRAQAQELAGRAAAQAQEEAAGYDGIANQLPGIPDDELPAFVAGLGRPNTAAARAVLARLAGGDLTGAEATKALGTLADELRGGNLALDAGEGTKAHAAAAALYQQALDASRAGDGAAAASYASDAKKLAGDRGVSALDIIGERAKEGRGYRAPERERARADVRAEGLDRPEALAARIAAVDRSIHAVVQRAQEGAWEGGMPVGVIDALQQQKVALTNAHRAAEANDPDLAADFVLQAEKYQVAEAKHADRSAKGQAAVLIARDRMRAARAEVGEARAGGKVGAGDLDPDVANMAAARDILVAAERFRERQQELRRAKKLVTDDPEEARAIAEGDKRVKPEPLDPETMAEHERNALRKIQESAETGIHRQLLDRLEDEKYFQSFGGDRQVRRGALDKYVSAGADALMNVLGQIVGGGQMIDRPTLDLLGAKDGARLLADYLANTRTSDELAAIRRGLGDYHVARAADVAAGALRACDESMEQARDFEIRGAGTAYDLSEMEAYNRLRLEAVNGAMASVGTAYGELNMCAELVWALGNAHRRPDERVEIKGGPRSDAALVVLAHSLGLRTGEYDIRPSKRVTGTNQVLPGSIAVSGDGVRRVVRERPDRDRASALRLGAIKRGEATTADDGTPIPGDQVGWLPVGIARRPHSTWQDPEKRPDRYDVAGDPDELTGDGLKAHVAGRLAAGMPPEQLYLELRGDPQAGDPSGRAAEVDRAFGLGEDENFDHTFRDRLRGRADALVREHHGGGDTDLHAQAIDEDHRAVEAIHRSLAQNPYGVYAFHGVGDLSVADRAHVRDYAFRHILDQPTAAELKEMREAAREDQAPEHDTFGNTIGAALPTGREGPGDDRWDTFAAHFPRQEDAYRAVLDHLKGGTLRAFAQNYGQVAGQALQTGSAPTWARDQARQIDGLKDATERTSLGDRTEGQLGGLWPAVADNFTPGKPVKLVPNLRMDGRFIQQQRAVKAIRAERRVLAALGVGSGKTLISLGAFTDAHHHGEARGALVAAPQNMVGQFGAEAATYIDPSARIKWHAKPGADGAERQRALASREHHIVVTTHQSLRDDVVKAVAEADHGGDAQKAEEYLMEQPRGMRAAAVRRAFEKKGWAHRLDYFAMDEGHEALNRKGKPNSLLANVMDAISDNAKHYVPMSGTPIKNDPSEAYDWLQKLRPDRYTDAGRDDWLRSYDGLMSLTPRINEARQGQRGKDDPKDWSHVALAEAVQRAMAPHVFAARVPLTTRLRERNVKVHLGPEHRRAYDGVTEDFAAANASKSRGEVNVAALKRLSPETFAGLPAPEHAARAQELNASLGMLREQAYNRVLHSGSKGHNDKLEAISQVVGDYRRQQSARGHRGKAGIVFTTGIDAAHQIAARLKEDGHRVGMITGPMSAEEKEREKLKFQPGDWKTNGEQHARTDVLVCTNAVSAGMDAPRGEFVVHHDVPMTAKVHEQRTARAYRLSNDHDVDVVNLVSDTPHEMKNLARLRTKYGLADVFQNPSENLDDSGLQRHINLARIAQAMGSARDRLAQGGARDLLAEARQAPRGPGDRHSAAQIQRHLKIGYGRAAQLADRLNVERGQGAHAG